MGMLPDLLSRWSVLNTGFLARQAEASEKAAMVGNVTKFVRLSLQSLVLGLGALLAIRGEVTSGMMIAGSILMGRALGPLEMLISVWRQWSSAKSAYERLVELLEGKFKLGQERSAEDKQSLLKNLESAKPARSIRDLTAGFYQRQRPTP